VNEESGFDAYIKRIKQQDQEILEALGSDFDEEGIPYWDKWGKDRKRSPCCKKRSAIFSPSNARMEAGLDDGA
jgi:hypothetical protein